MRTPEQLADALDRSLRQLGLIVDHDEPITHLIGKWPAEEAEAYRGHRFVFGARSAEQVRIDRLAAVLAAALTPDPDASARHLDKLVEALGIWSVSVLADTTAQEVNAWQKARPHNVIPVDTVARLEFAASALEVFTGRFGTNATRAWFTTPADWLGGHTPVQAIRGGQYRQVLTGARSIADGHLYAPLAEAPEAYTETAVLRYDPASHLIYFHTDAKYDVHILQPPAAGSRWSLATMNGRNWEDTWGRGVPFRPAPTPTLGDATDAEKWPLGTVAWDRLGSVLHRGPEGWDGGITALTGAGSPGKTAYPLTILGTFDAEDAGS
ncbi:hypothetical protein LG293_15995 (plasmid) [Citricoccus nitrophenolicus]